MTRGSILSNLKALIGPGIEVADTDLNLWINDAYMQICDAISAANPDYFTKTAYTSQVQGTQEYTLPSDYERMLMVNVQYAGVWRTALPFSSGINQIPVHEFTQSSQGYTADLPRYYTYGNSPVIIGFMPIPTDTSAASLKIWYVYTPSGLGDTNGDNDVPAFPAKYHGLLKFGAYATYLQEDDSHGAAMQTRQYFEQRLEQMLENMSMQQVSEPKTVTITSNYDLYIDKEYI